MRTREPEAGAARVVVLEDSHDGDSIAGALVAGGFDVTAASTVRTAWRAIAREAPVLAVLDARASDDAIRLVERVRSSGLSLPVLAVCAEGEDPVVTTLTAGADECLSHPYRATELKARVRALLRRTYGPAAWSPAPIRVGRLVVCPQTREASRDGVPVHLSPKEYGLLIALVENPCRTMARHELLARVWPETAEPNRRTLDMHIAWLRQKVEIDHRRPRIIRTVRSVGYLIASRRH